MAHEGALDFIRKQHRGVLATYRKDGQVQLSPVLAAVDAESRVVISTRVTSMKARNLRRNSRASFCALSERFFGAWYTVEGDVEILELPDAMEPLVDYYRATSGEHPDWDDYRKAMVSEGRVLLRLTVDRSGPTQQG
ncbi:MAG: PPOX class F420-dependent oxidoreductase [Candidatus Dormiibacterota bacterium]